jgi:hypothetical protein
VTHAVLGFRDNCNRYRRLKDPGFVMLMEARERSRNGRM